MVRPFPGALPLHPPRSPCRGHARRAASPTGREGRSALLPRHPILLGLPALAKGSLRPPWIPGIARTMVALQPTSSFVSWRCPKQMINGYAVVDAASLFSVRALLVRHKLRMVLQRA